MLKTIKKLLGFNQNFMTDNNLWEVINSSPLVLDGDDNLKERVIKETGWSDYKATSVLLAYKKFLYLASISKEVVPSKEIDVVWHNHILFTKDYFNRWSQILGKIIHHSPEVKGVRNNYNETFIENEKNFIREFGANDVSAKYFIINSYNVMNNTKSCSSSNYSRNENSGLKETSRTFSPTCGTSACHSIIHTPHSCSSHNSHTDSPTYSCSSSNDNSSSCSISSCSSSSCSSGCGGGD